MSTFIVVYKDSIYSALLLRRTNVFIHHLIRTIYAFLCILSYFSSSSFLYWTISFNIEDCKTKTHSNWIKKNETVLLYENRFSFQFDSIDLIICEYIYSFCALTIIFFFLVLVYCECTSVNRFWNAKRVKIDYHFSWVQNGFCVVALHLLYSFIFIFNWFELFSSGNGTVNSWKICSIEIVLSAVASLSDIDLSILLGFSQTIDCCCCCCLSVYMWLRSHTPI